MATLSGDTKIEPKPISIEPIQLKPKPVDLTKKPEELKDWPSHDYIKLNLTKNVREGYPWPVHVPRKKGMKKDYRDVRFFDSAHEILPYYMPKHNKKEALCFVRLSGQAISDNYILVCWGNPNEVFKGSHPSAIRLRIDKEKKKVLDVQKYKPQPIDAIKVAEVKK